MDEAFMLALQAVKDAVDADARAAARGRAARLAYPALAAAAAAARRTTRACLVEEAVQNAVMEFFKKGSDELIVISAPGLLRTIFRCRLKDQRRRDARYVFLAE